MQKSSKYFLFFIKTVLHTHFGTVDVVKMVAVVVVVVTHYDTTK